MALHYSPDGWPSNYAVDREVTSFFPNPPNRQPTGERRKNHAGGKPYSLSLTESLPAVVQTFNRRHGVNPAELVRTEYIDPRSEPRMLIQGTEINHRSARKLSVGVVERSAANPAEPFIRVLGSRVYADTVASGSNRERGT